MPSLQAMVSVGWVRKDSVMKDYYAPLVVGEYYHIYNRGNNKENIFYSPKNYAYFLKKYDDYLSPLVETYAYCLLPNHFHFLVRVKDIEPRAIPSLGAMESLDDNSAVVSEQFRRFFIGYSQAINKQEGRAGSLFQKGFKRIRIDSQEHLTYLVYYIHANPQKHQLLKDFRSYPHSSYSRILVDKQTRLHKQEVLEWFGSKSEFIEFHENDLEVNNIQHLMID